MEWDFGPGKTNDSVFLLAYITLVNRYTNNRMNHGINRIVIKPGINPLILKVIRILIEAGVAQDQ